MHNEGATGQFKDMMRRSINVVMDNEISSRSWYIFSVPLRKFTEAAQT